MKGSAVSVSKAAGERQETESVQKYCRRKQGLTSKTSFPLLLDVRGNCLVLVSAASSCSSSSFLQLHSTLLKFFGPVLASTFTADSMSPLILARIVAETQVPVLTWNRRPFVRTRGRIPIIVGRRPTKELHQQRDL